MRGHYVKTNQPYFTESLIYPIPEKNLKGLGVHTTFDIDRNLRFGPDTQDVSEIKYEMPDRLLETFIPAIQKTFKGIDVDKLQPDFSGIRPKILHEGKLHTDFWLGTPQTTGVAGYYEFCGIESPGLTAAPSLAKDFAEKISL